MRHVNWQTEENVKVLERLKNECTHVISDGKKNYEVVRPHCNITTSDERALAVYVDLKATMKQLFEIYKDKAKEQKHKKEELFKEFEEKSDDLLLSYHEAYRKGFGDVECLIHLCGIQGEGEDIELKVELYPVKADGKVYDVINLDFSDENGKKVTIPCLVLEVKEIEG